MEVEVAAVVAASVATVTFDRRDMANLQIACSDFDPSVHTGNPSVI